MPRPGTQAPCVRVVKPHPSVGMDGSQKAARTQEAILQGWAHKATRKLTTEIIAANRIYSSLPTMDGACVSAAGQRHPCRDRWLVSISPTVGVSAANIRGCAVPLDLARPSLQRVSPPKRVKRPSPAVTRCQAVMWKGERQQSDNFRQIAMKGVHDNGSGKICAL
eukprot:366301-Chlamydomonas_euryale.AAC.35